VTDYMVSIMTVILCNINRDIVLVITACDLEHTSVEC
jgi:hypothetical protein